MPSVVTPRRSSAGKRVLITGGSSGIGLACARELSARGASVALLARGEHALRQAAASLDGQAAVVVADVSDVAATRAAVDAAADELGGLDVVIANAGAAAYGPFVDMTPDDYQRTIGVTLLGIVNTTHAALPHLQRSAGSLIVVGSISGRLPTPWLAAYTAAKYGVRGFARTLQIELRSLGIPVNVALIAPGPVDTPFWRRARTTDSRVMPRVLGAYRPEDVAHEVVRAIGSARTERTVGGVLAIGALLDALAPNIALRAIGSVAKLGWLRRDDRPPQPDDILAAPGTEAQLRIGFRSRPSALGKLRELHHGVGAVLRATASRGGPIRLRPIGGTRDPAQMAARRPDEVLGDRAR